MGGRGRIQITSKICYINANRALNFDFSSKCYLSISSQKTHPLSIKIHKFKNPMFPIYNYT